MSNTWRYRVKDLLSEMYGIEGKVAVLSGGGGGIASGIAAALGACGARIALLDINSEPLSRTASPLREQGVEVEELVCDITSKSEVQAAVAATRERFGTIDFLINCAGLSHVEPTVDFDELRWDRVMAVNLKGTFLLCQAVGKVMLENNYGRIVNFSSVRGVQGRAGDMAYAPSKGAINQLTRSLAIEWATSGINVNAIAPAFTLTEMNRHQVEDEETYRWIMARIPKKRLCEIEYLTGPTIFLLSAASEFVTGHILYVDGAWTAA
jgi:NAD(P)-dependent dehydrogenase (short-subunit alcohol dehydrogenase family)